MRTEIIEILQSKYLEYCMQHIDTADEILRLLNVIGGFNHETISKIRNSQSDNNNLSQDPALSKAAVMRGVFCWAVTGTFHGSIIEAETEGEARCIFHKYYNGESILYIRRRNVPVWAF